jgi:hypothetical protein
MKIKKNKNLKGLDEWQYTILWALRLYLCLRFWW